MNQNTDIPPAMSASLAPQSLSLLPEPTRYANNYRPSLWSKRLGTDSWPSITIHRSRLRAQLRASTTEVQLLSKQDVLSPPWSLTWVRPGKTVMTFIPDRRWLWSPAWLVGFGFAIALLWQLSWLGVSHLNTRHAQGLGLQASVLSPALSVALNHWRPSTKKSSPQPSIKADNSTLTTTAKQQARQLAQRLGLGSAQAARHILGGHIEDHWAKAAGSLHQTPGTLRWPVPEGWFVRGYGSGTGGYHLAVDIAGTLATDVVASAKGIVAYAGNDVRGYGNIVMIIHPGGWATMYAHNRANYVVAGQRVKAGQSIASLGSTGISRGPHVHFEFLARGRNCDPVPLFRPHIRHRSHTQEQSHPLVWSAIHERPKGISCHHRRRHPHSRWVHHNEADEIESEAKPVNVEEAAPAATPEENKGKSFEEILREVRGY